MIKKNIVTKQLKVKILGGHWDKILQNSHLSTNLFQFKV